MNLVRPFPIAALAVPLLALALPAAAQEADSLGFVHVPPIVVTVSRVETPTEEVANAITVVTREEIERRQLRTVEEALRTVPGVSLVRSGGPGGTTTVFIRGRARSMRSSSSTESSSTTSRFRQAGTTSPRWGPPGSSGSRSCVVLRARSMDRTRSAES